MQLVQTGRVVIAEPDPQARQDLRDTLLQLGYEVVGQAADGLSALNLARSCHPDVVLLDLSLPIAGGLQAAGVISREQLAPVLIVTGFTQRELAHEAAACGAAAYLVKPCSERSLLAAMEIARERFRVSAALRVEIQALREEAETEKLLRQAKALLTAEYDLDDRQAQQRIERLAAKSCKSLREAASAIVLAARTRG